MNNIAKIKSHYKGPDAALVVKGNPWRGHSIYTVSFRGKTGGLIYWIDGERELTYDEVDKMYAAGYLFYDDQK